jgi:hypothetical protein
MPRTFDAITELIARIEQSAVDEAHVALAGNIILAVQTVHDPYRLIGFLLEGIAQTLQDRVPPAERQSAVDALHILLDRRFP